MRALSLKKVRGISDKTLAGDLLAASLKMSGGNALQKER